MTKENQKKLLNHYLALADNRLKDRGNKDFKPIIRENARKHADEILKNYPGLLETAKPMKAKGKK